MSTVIKCDRCGEIYKYSIENMTLEKVRRETKVPIATYDLCPSCFKELNSFLDRGKTQTELPKVSDKYDVFRMKDLIRNMNNKNYSLAGIGFFEYDDFRDGVDIILDNRLIRIIHIKPDKYPIEGISDISFNILEEYTVGEYMNIFDPINVIIEYAERETESGKDKKFRLYNANHSDKSKKNGLILAICTIHYGNMNYPHYVLYNAENLE